MNIHLLGTGAADGMPSFFGATELSDKIRQSGGKDIRTRCGAVVDGVLKIDFGPDTFVQAAQQGLKPSDWAWIIVTHSHFDHFDPGQLQYCLPPFVPIESRTPEVFGNQPVLEELARSFASADIITTHPIRSFETFQAGDYFITPVAAYHKLDEDSVNFMIERDGKRILYATDTGMYQEPTWEFIKGMRFDAVVIECTDGFNPSDYWGHLSCDEVLGMLERMRDLACIDDNTKIVTTHHSEGGNATHADLENFFAPQGVTVGYDGMAFEV
ncbi:MAG: MBL fold metallo-hydrolase [Fimbriimonadales bacterium]